MLPDNGVDYYPKVMQLHNLLNVIMTCVSTTQSHQCFRALYETMTEQATHLLCFQHNYHDIMTPGMIFAHLYQLICHLGQVCCTTQHFDVSGTVWDCTIVWDSNFGIHSTPVLPQ